MGNKIDGDGSVEKSQPMGMLLFRLRAELIVGGKLIDLETEKKVRLLELGRWEWRQPGVNKARQGSQREQGLTRELQVQVLSGSRWWRAARTRHRSWG